MQRTLAGPQCALSLGKPDESEGLPLHPMQSELPQRNHWISTLTERWETIASNWNRTAHLGEWNRQKIGQRFDQIVAALLLPEYFQQARYLTEFEGKGLCWALLDFVKPFVSSSLKFDQLTDSLISVLAVAYVKHKPYQQDEFAELASLIRRSVETLLRPAHFKK